jgi:glycosyltransferase involved in cell wall biosynthesis
MANKDVIRRFRVLVRRLKEQGFLRTCLWLLHKLVRKLTPILSLDKSDVLSHLDFVSLPPSHEIYSAQDLPRNTLNWFIPPFGRGSGGHLNIFRFISNLETLGFDCNIIIVANNEPLEDEQTLSSNIARWFVPLKAKVYRGIDSAPPAYVSLATEWRTAYYVRSFVKTKLRCYFVQDFEPWFFPIGSEYYLAEETYRFGFVGITAGDWLKEKLARDYGMTTYSVGFSYDRDLYKPLTHLDSKDPVKRVFFYARPPTPRRAFELGLLALKLVTKKIPGVEVVLAGWDLSGYQIPFEHKDLGVQSVAALPQIYNSCSVALVLSLTNLSLLPLELMACGVPIVSNDGPNNEWLLNAENSKMTRPTPESLADAICEVLTNQNEADRLVKAGFETANKTSWEAEANKMANFLKSMTQGQS